MIILTVITNGFTCHRLVRQLTALLKYYLTSQMVQQSHIFTNVQAIYTILSKMYITAAKARGITPKVVLFKHALKNACLPIITILGLSLPSLIGGSFVIEFIFAWPGLGQLGVQSVFSRDYPVLMATLFFSSFLIILGNLLADFAYALVDPRIKHQQQ